VTRAYDFLVEKSPMGNDSPSSAQTLAPPVPRKRFGANLRTFLTAVMGLLSILVFGLAAQRKNVLWLWIGFICAQVAGVFVQLLINREKKDASNRPDNRTSKTSSS